MARHMLDAAEAAEYLKSKLLDSAGKRLKKVLSHA